MSVLYVDVSHHDWSRAKGEMDWQAIKASTSPVMCARATYGDPSGWSRPSYHFGDMVTAAKRAGFDVLGGYHNLVKGDQASINRQVDWLRREMDKYGANWAMLDVERYPELVRADMHPRYDDVRQFCDRWHAVDQRVLAVYLPKWVWGYLGNPDLRPLKCPLVASNYGTNPDGSPAAVYKARGGDTGPGWGAYGGVTPSMWQYGSNIDCPGASGSTDVNAYKGSLAQLRALLTNTIEPQEADMDVTQDAWLYNASSISASIARMEDTAPIKNNDGKPGTPLPLGIVAAVKEMQASVKALAAQPAVVVDYDKLADAFFRRVIAGPAS